MRTLPDYRFFFRTALLVWHRRGERRSPKAKSSMIPEDARPRNNEPSAEFVPRSIASGQSPACLYGMGLSATCCQP